MSTLLGIVDKVENRSDIEDLVLRAQTESQAWIRQLGREDGGVIADRIITQILEDPGESDRVGESAVAYIKALIDSYQRRGIADDVVEIWRVECATELYHRFTEFRDNKRGYLH